MKSHLLEAVEELRAQGKSEEESIYIALSRFGDHGDIQSGLKEVLQQQKRFARNIFRAAVGFLTVESSVSPSLFLNTFMRAT